MCLSCWPWGKLFPGQDSYSQACHPRILTLKTFAFLRVRASDGWSLTLRTTFYWSQCGPEIHFKEILFSNYRYFPCTIWFVTLNFLLQIPILFSVSSFSLVFSCPPFLFILWMKWFPHNIFFHPSTYQAWLCLAVKMRLDLKFRVVWPQTT